MKILVLHSRLSGYWMACMRAFVERCGGTFYVVRKQISGNAPFSFQNEKGICLFDFSSFSNKELVDFSISLSPDLVYVAGWEEQVYLNISRYYYKKGVPVLCGLDNHWKGTPRQWAGKIYLKYLSPCYFTHLWIPGLYQFEYARNLGFNEKNILTGVYSADVTAFSSARKRSCKTNYPKSFLYVGRFIKRKGIMELALAFQQLKRSADTSWSLTLIGNGPLKKKLKKFDNIIIRDFVQPKELPEIMSDYGIFVLPSWREPWGVVVHEAAAAGLPIITTYECGAATAFVRNGYNGYLTRGGSVEHLCRSMKKIVNLSDEELFSMGERSYELSKQITPETWASTLNEVIIDNKYNDSYRD
ncbi:MAG TPA: glycosyltransferase family 4 protein [Balneolaceae bacterium]|nr:glycosyltransferase family 4 protein [Balneolaceae bacterium]